MSAQETFSIQIATLQAVADRLDESFSQAVDLILSSAGRVVILGVGKSGLIGHKIASTLSSTGTASINVHASDAVHGDLGMIVPEDIALLISYSGETEELLRVIPFLKSQGNRIIGITGDIGSTLAKHADVVLDVFVEREACPNNLAPTTSTTATLVIGDALASALILAKKFKPIDFARYHPGGNLGKRLLTHIKDVMQTTNLPVVSPEDNLRKVVDMMTSRRLVLSLVIDKEQLVGVITDGDLRKVFSTEENPLEQKASGIMSIKPLTIGQDQPITDAEILMRDAKVKALVVTEYPDSQKVVGILPILDL